MLHPGCLVTFYLFERVTAREKKQDTSSFHRLGTFHPTLPALPLQNNHHDLPINNSKNPCHLHNCPHSNSILLSASYTRNHICHLPSQTVKKHHLACLWINLVMECINGQGRSGPFIFGLRVLILRSCTELPQSLWIIQFASFINGLPVVILCLCTE